MTWLMDWRAPRSIWIHCGSTPCALAQRVHRLPSTALAQAYCGVGEQVTGLLRARLLPVAGVLVRVGVRVGGAGVLVRVGVGLGPMGVLVRVGVRVGPVGVLVRVGVTVGVIDPAPGTPMTLISNNEAQPVLEPVTVMRT